MRFDFALITIGFLRRNLYICNMNQTEKNKAKELARKNGFDHVHYYGKWKGYSAYVASKKEEVECSIGYPQFILVKNDIAHLAPYTQSPDIMEIVSMPMDYKETSL